MGGTASSRIIDVASISIDERVEAFTTPGRGFFDARKDWDRRIADYGEAIKLGPKDTGPSSFRCEAYRATGPRRGHCRSRPERSRSIRNMARPTTTVVWPLGLHEYDAALADHCEAVGVVSRVTSAYARRGRRIDGKGEFDQAVDVITEAGSIDPLCAFRFTAKGRVLQEKVVSEKERSRPAIAGCGGRHSFLIFLFGFRLAQHCLERQ